MIAILWMKALVLKAVSIYVMQVNIIIGIGFAKDLLSEEEYNSLTKMIVNANNLPNNTFIIFDNYSRFQDKERINVRLHESRGL